MVKEERKRERGDLKQPTSKPSNHDKRVVSGSFLEGKGCFDKLSSSYGKSAVLYAF